MSPPAPRLPPRPSAAALTLSLTLALAGCGGGSTAEPLACSDHTQCPGDAFCNAGACVASTPTPNTRSAALRRT